MELITLLRHDTVPLTKRWTRTGVIPAKPAKHFTVTEEAVSSLRELSTLLSEIECLPRTCVVRGMHIGEQAARKLYPDLPVGKTLRRNELLHDKPRSWLCIDVDSYKPKVEFDPANPMPALEAFTGTLPQPFHGVDFYWQLSSSAGSRGSEGILKAHLWFWLTRPLSGAQLQAWAATLDADIDRALFRPTQIHYTAAPLFDDGIRDPVPVRSGHYQGLISDVVDLELPEAASSPSSSSQQRLTTAIDRDPIVTVLEARNMILKRAPTGPLYIECPFEAEHSTPHHDGDTSTCYYPAHTGGYERGTFKCLHSHCEGRTQASFRAAIDYVEDLSADFSDLGTDSDDSTPAVPDAKHICSDQRNAQRIYEHFGSRIFFCNREWYAWDGKRWRGDERQIYRYACLLSSIINTEIERYRNECAASPTRDKEEEKQRKELLKSMGSWSRRSESRNAIEAAITLLRKLLTRSEAQLNPDPWQLNVNNGVVDLRTGELSAHVPDYLITRLIPIDYKPGASQSAWTEVLSTILCEDEIPLAERSLSQFIKRWYGYCATGSTREHVFAVHYGVGQNGKSTVTNTIEHILGEYTATAPTALLVGNSNEHPTGMADLWGRRCVTAHESDAGALLREGLIKQLTGGDRIKARWMRGDFFEFQPTHKLQMVTNHKPVIRGTDHGIWRRVMLIPFLQRFGTQKEVDEKSANRLVNKMIEQRLHTQVGREGVLAWLVEGAIEWHRNGLNPPDVVLDASREYRTEQDRVEQFVDECCELGEGHEVPLNADAFGLMQRYQRWCRESGYCALGKMKFMQELERIVPAFGKKTKKVTNTVGKRRSELRICGIMLADS